MEDSELFPGWLVGLSAPYALGDPLSNTRLPPPHLEDPGKLHKTRGIDPPGPQAKMYLDLPRRWGTTPGSSRCHTTSSEKVLCGVA